MKLTVDHLHVKTDAKQDKYIDDKLGKLDHLVSRHARRSAHADVKLKKGAGRGKKEFTCEVIIHLPKETITTKQTAQSIDAAVDLAEAKLKNQLKKYKDKHVLGRRQRLMRRLNIRRRQIT
ncbi:MAG TPA: ribosome-associated translation inhibitor RaiA [Candidatus Saccharimonadales bacterium]|nr:ribosome-associated translation inhibitor RaiA [Candidatus Saccharimonadales bacterium]